MNRFVLAFAVTLVLGLVDVSRAQGPCCLNGYTPGHCAGCYCCRFCDCPGPCGYRSPSFPPGPGPSTLTALPGLMPTTLIVSPPPTSTPPPASEAQPAPAAAARTAPTTQPPLVSADRKSSRVMSSQTALR